MFASSCKRGITVGTV